MKSILLGLLLMFPCVSMAFEYDIEVCLGYIDENKLDPDSFIPESDYNEKNAFKALEFFRRGMVESIQSKKDLSKLTHDISFNIQHSDSTVILHGYILKKEYELEKYKSLVKGGTNNKSVEQSKHKFCKFIEERGYHAD